MANGQVSSSAEVCQISVHKERTLTFENKVGRRLYDLWGLVSNRTAVQGVAVLADQAVYSLTNFIAGIVVARACPKTEYGNFVLFITILRFLGGIQNSMVSLPFTINYPRVGKDRKSTYLGNTLVSQFWISLAVGLLFLAATFTSRLASVNIEIIKSLEVLVFASIAFTARDCLRIMLLGQLRVWSTLLLSLIVGIFMLTGLFICQQFAALSTPVALAIAGIATGLPTCALGFLLLWKNSDVDREKLSSDLTLNWRHGKWLTVRTLVYTAAYSVYPFFLKASSDSEQLAVYGVCLSIAALANPVFMGLGSYLRPKFSHLAAYDEPALRSVVLKVEMGVVALVCLLLAAILYGGHDSVIILYGQKYSGLRWPLFFTSIGVGFSVAEMPFLIAAEARQDTRSTFIARFLSSIFSMTVGLLLVSVVGLYGAVLSFGISQLIGFLYLTRIFFST